MRKTIEFNERLGVTADTMEYPTVSERESFVRALLKMTTSRRQLASRSSMRAADRGAQVTSVYLRRMGILFAMGIAHALLVWNGDVLHMSALLGLVLLGLRRVSDRTVFALIIIALLLPGIRSGYAAITQEPWPIPRETIAPERDALGAGAIAHILETRRRQRGPASQSH